MGGTTCLSVPPWKSEALPNINMEIPGIEDKRLQTPEERRGITDAFPNIHYPCDSWTRVYTDGSVEDAVRNGGAGVCVQHSVDDEEMSVYQQDYIVQTTRLKQ